MTAKTEAAFAKMRHHNQKLKLKIVALEQKIIELELIIKKLEETYGSI